MATDYIKVSKFVAHKMGLADCRGRFADGSVILWLKDLSKADRDWAFHPEKTLADIGGVRLNPWEAKREMAKSVAQDCLPLPVPANPKWIDPESNAAENTQEADSGDLTGEPSGEAAGEPEPEPSGENAEAAADSGNNTETETEKSE